METHFIDINLFDTKKIIRKKGQSILTYDNKYDNNFGLFINSINDYCFENNILYFNLDNNNLL